MEKSHPRDLLSVETLGTCHHPSTKMSFRSLRFFCKIPVKEGAKKSILEIPPKPSVETPPKTESLLNVAILGANVRAGTVTALYLKQNPLIKSLYLYGNSDVRDMASDLRQMDTKSTIKGYSRTVHMHKALTASDIVVIIDTDKKLVAPHYKFHNSVDRLKFIGRKLVQYCPKAIIVNCVEPICCTTIFLYHILGHSPFFQPNRLIGSVAPLQVLINNATANYLTVDPEYVHVPLVGGPTSDNVIPLLSSMTPDSFMPNFHYTTLYNHIKKTCDWRQVNKIGNSLFSEGHGIAKLVHQVVKGLAGCPDVYASCFVRTNLAYLKGFFVNTVKFGRHGVDYICPLPSINKWEQGEFLKSLGDVRKNEKMVQQYRENMKKRDLCFVRRCK